MSLASVFPPSFSPHISSFIMNSCTPNLSLSLSLYLHFFLTFLGLPGLCPYIYMPLMCTLPFDNSFQRAFLLSISSPVNLHFSFSAPGEERRERVSTPGPNLEPLARPALPWVKALSARLPKCFPRSFLGAPSTPAAPERPVWPRRAPAPTSVLPLQCPPPKSSST